jgi:murein DD-endopeptidase MepM/ murein hydrolase activator NlpD
MITSATGVDPSLYTQAAAPTTGKQVEAWFAGMLVHEVLASGPLAKGAMANFSGVFEQELGKQIAATTNLGIADDLGLNETLHTAAPPQDARVSSGFGQRRDPFTGGLRNHDGVDIAAAAGTAINAPVDGIVRFAGARGGYGNVVVLDHGDGTESRYAHCDRLDVRAGDVVRAGDAIGTVGSTGRSTGPHVHVELRDGGRAINPTSLVDGLLDNGVLP